MEAWTERFKEEQALDSGVLTGVFYVKRLLEVVDHLKQEGPLGPLEDK